MNVTQATSCLQFSHSFFVSTVGFRGTGKIAFDSAVTAVLIEGAIFLFLAVSGIRYAIVKFIPEPVRLVRRAMPLFPFVL